ncbi:MAG: adenylyl cyclase class-3/4/guanylyl cyclase [Geminicoccaceae bacterium]|jgi:TolB-like protein/class 3 adenylate cyclase|nr:adenylyl cyclase class-3/4/guanylyl cyclase [Geminicoccaceae bacterium]MCE3246585.1 adenylyl cyclase class-3/4/guanylyl cyclase [Geminicoccaceae bacterium]
MSEALIAAPNQQVKTILCADVHGYSRLMARQEAETSQRVGRMIRLVQALIGDYGGHVMNIAGDGVVALFENARRAVRFALEIQHEFKNEAVWHPGGDEIAFRIGINIGKVIVRDSNLHGHSVNIAARVQELAPPGGVCITGAVQRAMEGPSGFEMRSLGTRMLKNIDEPVEIFAIEPAPEPAEVTGERHHPLSSLSQALEGGSVAVLPLDNLTGNPGDEHLCSGITRDIITNLSRFRDLLVIAPHSAFLFKQFDVSAEVFARQLGVRYLCTGSVERRGQKLRIRAQLTEALTGRVLWSERFGGQLEDVFDFQDEVIEMVAARLATHISAAERRRVQSAPVPDLQAYGLILRGQDLSLRFRREANLHARRLFEQAAEFDPGYGRCYAGMSRTFNLGWRYRWERQPARALDKAVELARAAIDRDNLDARGFGELGYACLYRKQHEESLAAYQRAHDLNPNDADILAEMGDSLVYAGRAEEAVNLLERAMCLNPYFPDWYLWYLGDAYFHLGQYEKTIEAVSRMRDQSEAQRLLASSHALLGHEEQAREHAKRLLAVHPNFSIAHWQHVPPYRDQSHLEPFLEGLRRAGLH